MPAGMAGARGEKTMGMRAIWAAGLVPIATVVALSGPAFAGEIIGLPIPTPRAPNLQVVTPTDGDRAPRPIGTFDGSKASAMWAESNMGCRQGETPDGATLDADQSDAACTRRTILQILLETHGYCFESYEYEWRPCGDIRKTNE
jgi:hypothetical protein